MPLPSYHHHHNWYNFYYLEISFLNETQAKKAKSIVGSKNVLSQAPEKLHRLIISWDTNLKKPIDGHLKRSKIFCCIFMIHNDVNLWKTKLGRGMAYSCRTNVFIKFYYLMKKEYTQLKTTQHKQNIFKSMGIYGFL